MIQKMQIFILGCMVGLVGCSQPHSPEESIHTFYESLNSQNYPELLSLFNLEENLRARKSESELYDILAIIFQDLAFNIQERGGIDKIEYHSIEYSPNKDQAIVRYTLSFKDGNSTFDTLSLTKDHTEFWRLTLE